MTTWSARMLQHPDAHKAVDSLRRMDPASRAYPTIELSWALTALVIGGIEANDMALAKRVANALIGSFRQESNLFPHVPIKKGLSAHGARVRCFANFVYPIQALSYLQSGYWRRPGRRDSLPLRCAYLPNEEALFTQTKTFDQDHSVSIEKGHRWLTNPAKISRSLVER